MLTRMGFRSLAAASRAVWPGTSTTALLDGLEAQDLANWRGAPDMIPEYTRKYGMDAQMAPKGSNRNTVASTVLEIPSTPGCVPLLQNEFDMNYTPLLHFRHGKGGVTISTLDLTGRVGTEPAATALASNLVRWIDRRPTEERATLVVQVPARERDAIAATLKNGGCVIYSGLGAAELAERNIATETKTLYRVAREPGTFSEKIPRNLLRWRDALTLPAITKADGGEISGDGLFLVRKNGGGTECFVQAAPAALANRYADDPAKRENILYSLNHLEQLQSRVATEFGASCPRDAIESIRAVSNAATFKEIPSWFVFGPHYGAKGSPLEKLSHAYPGEEQALSGDMNPNLTYTNAQGKNLDFRRTTVPDAHGLVNLEQSLEAFSPDMVVYAVAHVDAKEARQALLRLGFDYWGAVYLNGKRVLVVADGHNMPGPNEFKARIHLMKGENTLVVKTLAGSKGCGFWANLSEPGAKFSSDAADQRGKFSFYDKDITVRSPYEYVYW